MPPLVGEGQHQAPSLCPENSSTSKLQERPEILQITEPEIPALLFAGVETLSENRTGVVSHSPGKSHKESIRAVSKVLPGGIRAAALWRAGSLLLLQLLAAWE